MSQVFKPSSKFMRKKVEWAAVNPGEQGAPHCGSEVLKRVGCKKSLVLPRFVCVLGVSSIAGTLCDSPMIPALKLPLLDSLGLTSDFYSVFFLID